MSLHWYICLFLYIDIPTVLIILTLIWFCHETGSPCVVQAGLKCVTSSLNFSKARIHYAVWATKPSLLACFNAPNIGKHNIITPKNGTLRSSNNFTN